MTRSEEVRNGARGGDTSVVVRVVRKGRVNVAEEAREDSWRKDCGGGL